MNPSLPSQVDGNRPERVFRLLLGVLLAWGLIVGGVIGLTSPASANPAKPATDFSFYVRTGGAAAYGLGCNQGTFDKTRESSEVVLAFGGQTSDHTGVDLTGIEVIEPNEWVEWWSEEFARGYYSCSNSSSILHLGVGTNNDIDTSYTGGVTWGFIVKHVQAYVSQHYGQVVVYGANDIEPGFGSVSGSTAWAQGYDATTSALYINFGSADGCPYQGYVNNGACNNGWHQTDVAALAWGYPNAVSTPEIYNGNQAKQWGYLSAYSSREHTWGQIHFAAPWDEHDLDTGTYTAQQAWDALYNACVNAGVPDTPPYSMEIHTAA
jgi:hypothetical protein